MIVRDGRRESHDLGPRRTFRPSLMKIAAGYGEEATGRWQSAGMSALFTRKALERPRTERPAKVARVPRGILHGPPVPRGLLPVAWRRETCRPGLHPLPAEGRCLECKREALRRHRARLAA